MDRLPQRESIRAEDAAEAEAQGCLGQTFTQSQQDPYCFSMTPAEKVLAKHDWAKQHVDNLESAIDNFLRKNRHAIRREVDLEKEEASFYVEAIPVIPVEISLRLSDAIHNLRSTLDHLAYAIVTKCKGTIDRYTGFPISNTDKDFKSALMSRIKGAGQGCYEVIERIEPISVRNGEMGLGASLSRHYGEA